MPDNLVHYPPRLLKLDRRLGYPGAGLKLIVKEIQAGSSGKELRELIKEKYKITISAYQLRFYYNNREEIRELNLQRIAYHADSWL